jgi:hypothetical protein
MHFLPFFAVFLLARSLSLCSLPHFFFSFVTRPTEPQPMYGDMPIKPAVILTRAPHYDAATMGAAWGADNADDKKVLFPPPPPLV